MVCKNIAARMAFALTQPSVSLVNHFSANHSPHAAKKSVQMGR
jgi:hypothetical protein